MAFRFSGRGIVDYLGIDANYVGPNRLKIQQNKFVVTNLESGFSLDRRFDLAVCLEVAELVEAAFAVVDLPWQKYVKHDPAFDRPTEPARLVGCSDKIRKILGWKPRGTFRELV